MMMMTKNCARVMQVVLAFSNNLIEFWKIGQLDIDLKCLTSDFKNGQPILSNVFDEKEAQYHKDCHSKYNKQKLQRQKAKICKLEQCDAIARRSSIKRSVNGFFCVICSNEGSPDNMHADGTFHAKKDELNTKHNIELTEKLRKMALETGNESIKNYTKMYSSFQRVLLSR